MDSEIQMVRQALVERRDAFQRAIDAFDVALGLGTIAPTETATTRKATKRTATKKASTGTRAAPSGGRFDLATARDTAIKAALKKGPQPSSELMAVLPKESGQTAEQRETALRNALSRLRMRKEIKPVDDGWALA